MSQELEKIGMRRIALRKEYSHEYGLSFEEWIIQKLVKAEQRAKELEDFTRVVAELAPIPNAALFTERERYEHTEQFRALGKEAKKLLPKEYISLVLEWVDDIASEND